MKARDFFRMWIASVHAAGGEMWSGLAGMGVYRKTTINTAEAQLGSAYAREHGLMIDSMMRDAKGMRMTP